MIIRIVDNRNNRLSSLFHIFFSLSKKGFGRLDERCFCIDSSLSFEPRNEAEYIFLLIQKDSYMNGYGTVCYILKNYENENNN